MVMRDNGDASQRKRITNELRDIGGFNILRPP
jgi:hypothetical protein